MSTVITRRLDLVVLLIDTTTGYRIGDTGARFIPEGIDPVTPLSKGNGVYILIDSGRKDFSMRIRLSGYEEAVEEVRYEELDSRMPTLKVFMIPSEDAERKGDCIAIKGKLPGLLSVSATETDNVLALTDAYDKRKNVLSVYGNPINEEGAPYALLSGGKDSFEPLKIAGEVSKTAVNLKEPFAGEFSRNLPICRMIFGRVEEDGKYLLRIRNNNSGKKLLIREETEKGVRFIQTDAAAFADTVLE